jgi:endonuclease/exonuclease/phosphatase family metal-dependent hydrolase
MRLVTLNTWGMRGDWSARLRAFQDGFRALDADIITLQETILTDEVDQVAEMLGTEYVVTQQLDREADGQGISTASRWPIGKVFEIDLHVTERTHDFACTCLVSEVLAPEPLGRIWVANHFPDYQLDHERERRLQTVIAARRLESLVAQSPGHVVVAGDLDGDSASDSLRFWTGRHVIDDTSVCYRSAWEAMHPTEPLATYLPENPHQVDLDWPFRGIDHVLVRCGHSGPTLTIAGCRRVFDRGRTVPSDHYGLVVDLEPPAAGSPPRSFSSQAHPQTRMGPRGSPHRGGPGYR